MGLETNNEQRIYLTLIDEEIDLCIEYMSENGKVFAINGYQTPFDNVLSTNHFGYETWPKDIINLNSGLV